MNPTRVRALSVVLTDPADPAKNTLTYAKQTLDAASTQIVTAVPEVKTCP